MSPQGRPKDEYRSAQRGRIPMNLPEPDPAAREHSARVVDALRREIVDAGGWIPFSRYMELVLYAPGLTTKDDIATVVSSVDRPVNVLMGLKGVELSVAALSAIGVKRISVGSALARCAFSALLRGAREMKEHGTFRFADDAETFRAINALFVSDDQK